MTENEDKERSEDTTSEPRKGSVGLSCLQTLGVVILAVVLVTGAFLLTLYLSCGGVARRGGVISSLG